MGYGAAAPELKGTLGFFSSAMLMTTQSHKVCSFRTFLKELHKAMNEMGLSSSHCLFQHVRVLSSCYCHTSFVFIINDMISKYG